jgi:D-alanyl-lipoteichoic acid acyltransferase DltB (MBOAT superfamily)
MLFPTIQFVGFFLLFILVWEVLGTSATRRQHLIAAASAVFYACASPVMLAYLAVWSVVLTLAGRSEKRGVAIGATAAGVLQLVFWKSFELFPRSDLPTPLSHWAIPLGVSFFTFQGLTYLFQRMKGELPEAWPVLRVFSFCAFFPTLVSGPILRAKDWYRDLEQPVRPDIERALSAIVLGLLYKLVFSTLLAGFTDPLYSEPGSQSALGLLLGLYGYAFQLYCDFCGYSLMALGVSALLGFSVPANFDRPYLATSVQGFWRAWHMSFSSWLRDYLYIGALGGNRKGPIRKVVNVLVTFTLCGAWHGFALHYLVWGVWQALAVAWSSVVKFRVPAWLSRILAFHIVALGWVFFRAASFSDALDYLTALVTGEWGWQSQYALVIAWVAGAALLHVLEPWILEGAAKIGAGLRLTVLQAGYWAALVVAVLLASPPGMPPFIYASY